MVKYDVIHSLTNNLMIICEKLMHAGLARRNYMQEKFLFEFILQSCLQQEPGCHVSSAHLSRGVDSLTV